MEIVKIALLILTAVIISGGIPTLSKEITLFITFSCCTAVLIYIVNFLLPVVEYVKNLAEKIVFDDISVIIKAVGIGLITQFVSDVALDCNNRTLANQMIFAGRICILITGLPVFMEVFEIIERLAG